MLLCHLTLFFFCLLLGLCKLLPAETCAPYIKAGVEQTIFTLPSPSMSGNSMPCENW
jgi:hypothetical protein